MRLSEGERIYYEFSSGTALRFNIHHHEGEEVLYPVPVKLASSEKAVFAAESSNHYCLMWNNPGQETAELKFQYRKQGDNDL